VTCDAGPDGYVSLLGGACVPLLQRVSCEIAVYPLNRFAWT